MVIRHYMTRDKILWWNATIFRYHATWRIALVQFWLTVDSPPWKHPICKYLVQELGNVGTKKCHFPQLLCGRPNRRHYGSCPILRLQSFLSVRPVALLARPTHVEL